MASPLDALKLRISEVYTSVQGESTFAGRPCVFVRTTGCPLRCVWCDTEHAFTGGDDRSVQGVLDQVLSEAVEVVEITGGEPLVQKNVLPLMAALADAGRTVLLETSGAYDIATVDPRVHVIMDLKCPDSGESERNLYSNIEHLDERDEVKFVIASRRDYEFARETIKEHRLDQRCEVLISTVFDTVDRRSVVEWILADRLNVRFQLQLHKFIWPPDAQGV